MTDRIKIALGGVRTIRTLMSMTGRLCGWSLIIIITMALVCPVWVLFDAVIIAHVLLLAVPTWILIHPVVHHYYECPRPDTNHVILAIARIVKLAPAFILNVVGWALAVVFLAGTAAGIVGTILAICQALFK